MENSISFEAVTYETMVYLETGNQPMTIPVTLLQHYMSPKFIVFSIICVVDLLHQTISKTIRSAAVLLFECNIITGQDWWIGTEDTW